MNEEPSVVSEGISRYDDVCSMLGKGVTVSLPATAVASVDPDSFFKAGFASSDEIFVIEVEELRI